MNVSSSTNSIQMLKAQQAWEARQANRKPTAEKTAPSNTAPAVETTRPDIAIDLPRSSGMNQLVQDVQQVAEKAGFVGLSDKDIFRAYTNGESLLADYRV